MSHTDDLIEIRICAETDALAFRDLRLEALRFHPEAFGADYATNEQAPLSFWTERLRQSADSQAQAIFFAVADGELVGMTGVRRGDSPKTAHVGMIWGVYVRSGWRGRQRADRLIGACAEWAGQRGVRLLNLAVATHNLGAIRCYLRCGFTVYGIEQEAIAYHGRFYDELLMVKRLHESR